MSVSFHELRISAVVRETPECSSFELSVPASSREAFSYKAGQHLTFAFPWDDFEITRCYSLSSAPEVDDNLRIAVKRVPGGRISNWMNDQLSPGDTLRVSVPEGRFVLDPQTRQNMPLFFFAGGSGITPVLSLIKSALASSKRRMKLVYANRDAASVIYRDEIERLAEFHPERVEVCHHLDADQGQLDAAQLAAHVRGFEEGEFYVCGPEPFMDLVEKTLTHLGVHAELVYTERFVSPVDPDRAAAERSVEPALEAPEAFSLWLHGRSRTVPYVKDKTLLECAHLAGLQPASSCESGFCGSCMAHVNTGSVHMRRHEALSERDLSRGVALLCQSVPASREPLELDCDSTSFRKASAVKSSYSKRVSQIGVAACFGFMLAGTLILRLVP
jgi:3-ketosteroid 9alpha-monooxygenase subunit B